MKPIKTGCLSGLFFAAGMALFDYADGTEFNWAKFSFNSLLFGGAMGLMTYKSLKNLTK